MLEFPIHKNTNLLFPTPFYESNITSRMLLDSKRSIAMESVSHFHHEADHVRVAAPRYRAVPEKFSAHMQ
jgi:hypothetical protein